MQNNKRLTPPLAWAGGKVRQAQWIINHFPDKFHTYIEVFGGMAAVLTAKIPSSVEIYNDVDDNLLNFMMTMKDHPDELCARLDGLPYSRKLFMQWRDEPMPEDNIERAARWFYVVRCGYGAVSSVFERKSGWSSSTVINTAARYNTSVERIKKFSDRFRNVQIESMDFRKLLWRKDKENVLFYIDPPYFNIKGLYKGNFVLQDHVDLFNSLKNIRGKVIISYYPSEPVDWYLDAGWHKAEFETKMRLHGKTLKERHTEKSLPKRLEVILYNYEKQDTHILEV
jgi:DNA adenine methylase